MDTLIVYYSRDGHTRKAAAALAGRLSATRAEIPCNRYDGLPRGIFNAGHDSFHREAPEIGTVSPDPSGFDRVLVGGPVWVWSAAPPVRSFLKGHDLTGKAVGLFVTYGGGPHARALEQMEAALGRQAEARAAFGAKTLKDQIALDRAVSQTLRALDGTAPSRAVSA
jgi:menaquinone-dependent protoporphyrinogen IX oxidase